MQSDKIQSWYFTSTDEFESDDFFIEGFDFILQGALLKNELLMTREVLDYKLVRERRATIEQKITVIQPSNLRNKSETSSLT